jgi:2-polyprenyl-3-methyl-5-hydroxy-6-metoxy-1,4-benzoquinol methylase
LKTLDRLLQRWRIAKAGPFIPAGATVLDVGSADGALFERLGSRIAYGVGVDPALEATIERPRYRLVAGRFPAALDADGPFDAITMLAVLEHVPPEEYAALADACARLLRPEGRLVITVPQPAVDRVLRVLLRIRLIDGMACEEHAGFDPELTTRIFGADGWRPVARERFQLGLNNLFVFARR